MKKQQIAKLLVLGMVLAMLPISAFAATVTVGPDDIHFENGAYYAIDPDTGIRYPVTHVGNGTYSYEVPDVTPVVPETPGREESAGKPAGGPAALSPVVVETVGEVTAEVNDAGQVVASTAVKVEVRTETNAAGETVSVAAAALTESAVAGLAGRLAEAKADVVILKIESGAAGKAVVTFPAAALTSLALDTGADLTVASAVAAVTIPNAVLTALPAGAGTMEVIAGKNADGVITIALLAGGKAVDLSAGLSVAIPMPDKDRNVAGVYLTAADGREREIEDWEITPSGILMLTVTANGSIRIARPYAS